MQSDDSGRILRFRTRAKAPARSTERHDAADSPVADLGSYERGANEADDYRHRMRINALTAVALALLIGCGIWLVDAIAQLRKNQDCALSGRRNCAPISVPLTER